MKKHIFEENGLMYENYHPEYYRKINIPKEDWLDCFGSMLFDTFNGDPGDAAKNLKIKRKLFMYMYYI